MLLVMTVRVMQLWWCMAAVAPADGRRTAVQWRRFLDWDGLTGLMDAVEIPGLTGTMKGRCFADHPVGVAAGTNGMNGIVTVEGPVGVTCERAVLTTRGPWPSARGIELRVSI
jgi:hypothetical protein